jgi:release factor glutamine methyltransferase
MPSLEQLETRWLREGARDDQELQSFYARRRGGEPLHRILGWREFWGLKFYLSRQTLEPRPDSETMIEVLLQQRADKTQAHRILDLGTGTGCLLLAALHEYQNATGVGIDAALGAVTAAQKNAEHLGLAARAEFRQVNWHHADALLALGQFDIILANPPYIPHQDIATLQTEVREYDPIAALDGGHDGLDSYRHLSEQLRYLLKPDGIALFEIGHDQAGPVQAILSLRGFHPSGAFKDLGGNDRVIVATQP